MRVGASAERPIVRMCCETPLGRQHDSGCQYASAGILELDAPVPGHKGVKLARFDLLPWDALWKVAEHYGKGAEKYAARNWERGYEYSKIVGQIGRHLAAIASGELIDPENGSPHAAAIAFGALALIAFEARGIGTNDLPQLDTHLDSELLNPEEIEEARQEATGA
jgi:dATP/dGTP diphosphohydrolase